MVSSAKTVQWHDGAQHHQNRHLLPVSDLKVTGYEAVELFQWEMCLQLHSRGASMKVPTVDVEAGKWIKIKTSPKKASEIKTFLNYK
eukprot:4417416-Ditylum_brightwellii.AAC.1